MNDKCWPLLKTTWLRLSQPLKRHLSINTEIMAAMNSDLLFLKYYCTNIFKITDLLKMYPDHCKMKCCYSWQQKNDLSTVTCCFVPSWCITANTAYNRTDLSHITTREEEPDGDKWMLDDKLRVMYTHKHIRQWNVPLTLSPSLVALQLQLRKIKLILTVYTEQQCE